MKKFISTALCTAMIFSSASVFADKNTTLSEKPEIRFLQENGYLKGRENGLELESGVTRAEALTMLLRICGEEDAAFGNKSEENEVVNEAVATEYEIVKGELLETEENGVVIETENGKVLINTENALLKGTDPEKAEKRSFVSAVVSAQRTKSIPAMTGGFVVVISDKLSVDLVEVAEVTEEDGTYRILSADGEYIAVAGENTDVKPLKTKNIIKLEDIEKGDKIAVLSEAATMSLPAQLMAEEIIVIEKAFENADSPEDKKDIGAVIDGIADKLFKNKRPAKNFTDVIGHWAEKLIKYSYENGYIDGESDTEFNPDGAVKGRELVKMLLSKLGKENVTIENAYDIAKECGLIGDASIDKAVSDNCELTREDMSMLCYSFLKLPIEK